MSTFNLDFGECSLNGQNLESDDETLDVVEWISSENDTFNFYSLNGVVDPEHQDYIVLNMSIPAYFGLGEGGVSRDYNGMFLFKASDNPNARGFRERRRNRGSQGCPYFLDMGRRKFFEFNGNFFHPFVLENGTVGYYATEKQGNKDWMQALSDGKTDVAANSPIVYDPTLRLFVTRDASLHFFEEE